MAAPARGVGARSHQRGGLALPGPGWAARASWQGSGMPGMLMQQKGEDRLGLSMLCQTPLETSPPHPAVLGLELLSPTAAVGGFDPRAQRFPAQNLHR